MADERWLRIRELFEATVSLNTAERKAFLAGACADDETLAREIEQLVASYQQSATFLEAPHGGVLSGDLEGRRLGAYELGPLIGAGGMGDVYRARDTRLNRTVAIKLRAGRVAERPDVREQFAREARAISALNHPHICLLHDVGRQELLDFLVMEYVEGAPIDEYCRSNQLSTRERLKIFRDVCEAVHYAHQNLVVHRDLKPANILVTADGQPKLLDFGIAKLIDAAAPAVSSATMSQALTPEYASPEQVRGDTVTTSADIYALGVVLYELLAGRRPYAIRTTSLEDIVRTVCGTEPVAPSAAVREAQQGRSSGPSAAKELAGDLDAIVLKALRKEPDRRYRSAQELADDIERYLERQPVAARGDAVSYRVRKFVARHRTGAIVAIVFVAGLLSAMALIVRQSRIADVQRQRAERRFADVRKLAGSFLFEFHDAIRQLPGSTRARQLVMTRALEYLDSLAEESAGDPTLRAELARAYKQVADIQGGWREANLGDTAGALASYRKALALQEDLARVRADDRSLLRDLARTLIAIGDLQLMRAETAMALENFRRALSINQQLSAGPLTDRELRRDVAISHYRVGNAFQELLDYPHADTSLRESIAILQALVSDPKDVESRHALARSYKRLALVRAAMGDDDGSVAMAGEAIRLVEAAALDDPMNTTIRNEVAMSHLVMGQAQMRLRQFEPALISLRRAEAITRAMAQTDPNNVQARWMQGLELNLIGVILKELHRHHDAIAAHQQALSLLEALARSDPSHETYQYNVANTCQLIGDVFIVVAEAPPPSAARLRAWTDARTWYRRSAAIFDAMRQRGTLTVEFAPDAARVAAALVKIDRALVNGPAPCVEAGCHSPD